MQTWVCPRAPRDSLCSCASACSASAGQTTRLSRPRLQSNKPLAPAQGLLGTARRCRVEVQPAAVRSRCSLQVRSQSGSSWSGGRAARVARGVCDAGAEEVGAALPLLPWEPPRHSVCFSLTSRGAETQHTAAPVPRARSPARCTHAACLPSAPRPQGVDTPTLPPPPSSSPHSGPPSQAGGQPRRSVARCSHDAG